MEGLGGGLTIICNIYSPVRSLVNQQIEFYESLNRLIEEFESTYVLYEPNLIILGDFNLRKRRHCSKITVVFDKVGTLCQQKVAGHEVLNSRLSAPPMC